MQTPFLVLPLPWQGRQDWQERRGPLGRGLGWWSAANLQRLPIGLQAAGSAAIRKQRPQRTAKSEANKRPVDRKVAWVLVALPASLHSLRRSPPHPSPPVSACQSARQSDFLHSFIWRDEPEDAARHLVTYLTGPTDASPFASESTPPANRWDIEASPGVTCPERACGLGQLS